MRSGKAVGGQLLVPFIPKGHLPSCPVLPETNLCTFNKSLPLFVESKFYRFLLHRTERAPSTQGNLIKEGLEVPSGLVKEYDMNPGEA